MFSSSLVMPGISLFCIKGDENGKSGVATDHTWDKYIIVGSFKQIFRDLYNILSKGA